MPSKDYLNSLLHHLKNYGVPDWLWNDLHRVARASAGGKARHRIPTEINSLEKIALSDIRPGKIRDVDNKELTEIWLRLNQVFLNAIKAKRSTENIVNAAIFTIAEMKKRKFKVNSSLALFREAQEFNKNSENNGGNLKHRLSGLEDVVVVENFVSIVGSSAKGKDNPHDLDIVFRGNNEKGHFKIKHDNVTLPVRNSLDPDKKGYLHFIDNPQGPHGDYIPLFDLILRPRCKYNKVIIKEAKGLMLDLGSGGKSPEGHKGIDINPELGDLVADLEEGIPELDESASVIRANHVLEHISNPDKIMREIHRVLMPGGAAIITVPSTRGEGAFAHPDHKSFWNKSSFAFWTDKEYTEDRPSFELEHLEERGEGDRIYVDAVLRKPGGLEKSFEPFKRFIPPKPQLAGLTEIFRIDELWKWAEKRIPVSVGPKWNGFRAIAEKKAGKVKLWTEGKIGQDISDKFPDLKKAFISIPGEWILDLDLAIEKKGKRLPRIELQKLNAKEVVLEPGEKVVATIFGTPYLNEDISELPFKERREKLQSFAKKNFKEPVKLSPIKWVSSKEDLSKAVKWALGFDRSEGAVAKSERGKYVERSTAEWSKIKSVAELKVIVLQTKAVKGGGWNYRGGLILSSGEDWKNIKDFEGKNYVDLGWSFNTKVKAKKGDIVTSRILELMPNEEKKTLTWLGANIIDVDQSRKEPVSTGQAQDIARRRGVLQKEQPDVPTIGPEGARVAFVGSAPGQTEAKEKEPFVGPAGETFDELYLESLGLSRKEVVITNVVPMLLTRGKALRDPTKDEIDKWKPWLSDQLDKKNPEIIVALGEIASRALGDRADIELPHPAAVRRFGRTKKLDEGLAKLKGILSKIEKAEDEEGGTRSDAAKKFWKDNWQDMYPISGNGDFTYHHHWMGLTEEESKLPEKDLFGTKNSLHGDLRLDAKNKSLWGFSVFLGKPKDNEKVGGDKLFALEPKENLRGAFKLAQPEAWLTIARKTPYVAAPGDPGTSAVSFSKFFDETHGNYEMGVWRQHAMEIFVKEGPLKGRIIFQAIPTEEGRVWNITRPKDQTPLAESRDKDDVIAEIKKRGQKWLVWAKPGMKPEKIDVKSGKVEKGLRVNICKYHKEKQVVQGIVLDPYIVDAQNDWISPNEVENAMYYWMENSQDIGIRHNNITKKAIVVESYMLPYPTTDDYQAAMAGEEHDIYLMKIGDDYAHSGSGIISVMVKDKDLWDDIKTKKFYKAFSIGGKGWRTKITKSAMPKVKRVLKIG